MFDHEKINAIQTARAWLAVDPIFLDTETTGLDEDAEMCEISIIDAQGNTLLNTLVKTANPIPAEATRIHGISNEMVADAPTYPDLYPTVAQILSGRTVVIYNSGYDTRIITQSARESGLLKSAFDDDFNADAYLLHPPEATYVCAMLAYADFYGDWNDYRQNNRWQKLTNAAQQCGIVLPPGMNAHRALADAEMTRQIVVYMAQTYLPKKQTLTI